MLRDWIRQELIHTDRGRRYVCRPPTVRTVALLLELFGPMLASVAAEWAKSEVAWDHDATGRLLATITDDERSIPVLASCVTLQGGSAGDIDEALARLPDVRLTLALLCAAMFDAERALPEVEPALAAARGESQGEGGSWDGTFLAVAASTGLHPLDVGELPFGLFLALRDQVSGTGSSADGPAASHAMSVDEFMGGA